MPVDNVLLICALAWATWFIRNKKLFKGSFIDPVPTGIGFTKLVHDYQLFSNKCCVACPQSFISGSYWLAPMTSWVKVNFDVYVPSDSVRRVGGGD